MSRSHDFVPLLPWEDSVLAQAREHELEGQAELALRLYRDILADPYPAHWQALGAYEALCRRLGRDDEAYAFLCSLARKYEACSYLGALTVWRAAAGWKPFALEPWLEIARLHDADRLPLSTATRASLQRAHERFLAAGDGASAARLREVATFGPEDLVRERAERERERGEAAAREGRLEEALPAFREAVALDDGDVAARRGLRDALLRSGDLAGAAAQSAALAGFLRSRGEVVAAEAEERTRDRLDPLRAASWREQGLLREREGDLALARRFLSEALRLDPDDAGAWYALGRIAHWSGDDDGQQRAHQGLARLGSEPASRFAAEFLDIPGAERRLELPDISLGVLLGRDARRGGPWRRLGPARGPWVIPPGKDLRLVVVDPLRGAPPDLEPLRRLSPDALDELSLAGVRLDDDSLASVGHLAGLKVLEMGGSDLAASGVLAHPERLVGLHVSRVAEAVEGFGLTSRGLRHLEGLLALRDLDLSTSGVSDPGLRYLARLTELETLRLGRSGVGDAGIEALACLGRLRRLDLQQTRVSGAGLARLAAIGSLEVLALANTALSVEGVLDLIRLPCLRGLDLAGTGALPENVQELRVLEVLDLSRNPVADQDLPALVGLPRLRVLYLAGTRVTGQGLRWLREATGRDVVGHLDLSADLDRLEGGGT